MKKVGIVGGIGPVSTLDYYKDIIDGIRTRSKDDNYPKIVIDSINMTEMLKYVEKNDSDSLISLLLNSINNLASAGADFAVIASNTPHIVFDAINKKSVLPLVSIVEETCKYAKSLGLKRVVVLGTYFTMNSGLYTNAFKKYDMDAFVPEQNGQNSVHNIIFPNLENGIVIPSDKTKMLNIANDLIKTYDAEALVLGCTELPLMIKQADIQTKILNTTQIHINSIINIII